jgi:hypothetical protein
MSRNFNALPKQTVSILPWKRKDRFVIECEAESKAELVRLAAEGGGRVRVMPEGARTISKKHKWGSGQDPRHHVGSVPVRLSERGLAPVGKSGTVLASDVPWN